jgi:hypothetical protein
MAKQMLAVFNKRWARWHKPIHTLAYALDPAYQSHVLTAPEKQDVKAMIQRLRPEQFAEILIEFTTYKANAGVFSKQEWEAVDKHHAYQWWDAFGDCFSKLQSLAVDVLSKCCAASACEFNWSQVSRVERKGRARLAPATTDKAVNVHAMHHLGQAVKRASPMGLPTMDDVIVSIVEDTEDSAPIGDAIDYVVLDAAPTPGEQSDSDDSDHEQQPASLSKAQKALYADWSQRQTLL